MGSNFDINGAKRKDKMELPNGSYICPVGFRVSTNAEFSEEALDV